MMNFFGWHGRGSSTGPQPDGEGSKSPESDLKVDAKQLLACLVRLCQGPEAHPFVRPLGKTFALLGEAAHGGAACGIGSAARSDPSTWVPSLTAAWEFLMPSETPLRHFEFALNAHKNKAATDHFIQLVAEVTPTEWRSDWLRNAEEFAARCREVWELHAYFVFLDIKGDRVLFEQTAHRLSRALECSIRSFVGCLAHTRPWVEDTLRALAKQELRPLLERHHADALRQWRRAWQERMRGAPERGRLLEEAQHGNRFWESYFTHLFKITWPDFMEAFEHFYTLGKCPVDLVHQLRLRVDPTLQHQVSRSTWKRLLQDHGRIWDVADVLLAEVLEDIPSRVYRADPLRCSGRYNVSCQGEAPEEFHAASSSNAVPHPYGSATATSSGTPSLDSPQSLHMCAREALKPRAWFPFAQSGSEDGDMAIPTPNDLRLRQGPDSSQLGNASARRPTTAWDDFVAQLCAQSRPWWGGVGEAAAVEDAGTEEPLRIAALRAVNSSIAYTHRALVFRVVSGDLAQHKPILELPKSEGASRAVGSPRSGDASKLSPREKDDAPQPFPSLVVMANGTRFHGVTKFGRTSSRRTLLPDNPMSEPIASRSHFNVVYEQETDRYFLMDAGSKWGTFVKIGASVTLSCGDWIRVGGVEFIIRFCGGGCSCSKRHAHYRLHSLRLLREHQVWNRLSTPTAHPLGSSRLVKLPRHALSAEGALHPDGVKIRTNKSSSSPSKSHLPGTDAPTTGGNASNDSQEAQHSAFSVEAAKASSFPGNESTDRPGDDSDEAQNDVGSSSDEERAVQDELLLLLSSRRPRGWTTASARLCQRSAMRNVGSEDQLAAAMPDDPHIQMAASGSSSSSRAPISSQRHRVPAPRATPVPIAPLELDFISGPRMGEKLVVCERVCTLGRGEGNTIQVNDSQLASVSRVHSIFEYSGNRWHMRDNGSTNGTWRRLSCILEPSEPIPLQHGVSIQAGVHEFLVEEATMRQSWFPSIAFATFEELCEQERLEQQQFRDIDDSNVWRDPF